MPRPSTHLRSGVASPTCRPTEVPESISQCTADHPSAELEGERKTVTVLFADIKSSMELIEDLDPKEARAIVDPALKLMIDAVHHYEGYVAQSTGDGIFVLLGAPVAHEDHPQRALYAAVPMQEELKRYSDRIRTEGRPPIQARVGVHTGEGVVRSITTGEGRTDHAPVAHSTGIAARMQSLALVESIAAAEQVRKLSEGYFLFKSLAPTKVKAVSEPVTVYELADSVPALCLEFAARAPLRSQSGTARNPDPGKETSLGGRSGPDSPQSSVAVGHRAGAQTPPSLGQASQVRFLRKCWWIASTRQAQEGNSTELPALIRRTWVELAGPI